jgi:2-methylcitrate dehydratase PrpD
MTQAEQMARFIARASYEDLSAGAREELKIRILDALGCAIGALGGGTSSSDSHAGRRFRGHASMFVDRRRDDRSGSDGFL